MRKSKFQHLVFSIFSNTLGNYPYYPFIAKDVKEGIRKYLKFVDNREAICEGAELHIIGVCDVFPDSPEPANLSPYIVPKRVELIDNFLSKIVVLGDFYLDKFNRYLKVLFERYKFYGKRGKEN